MKRMALALTALAFAAAAHAQVTVTDPWVRATVSQQKATGLFLRIHAAQDVRLVAAQSPVAGVAEVHEMIMQGDVMKMRAVQGGLPIAKGSTVSLKPGGYHVMLMDLKQQIKSGDTVPVTLTFEDAASRKRFTHEVKAPVTALGAGNAGAPARGMPMPHGQH